jgi:thymidylate synthase (FAD)
VLKFYRAPVVTLVGWTNFDEPAHMPVAWGADEPAEGEKLAEFAGRLCYMSQHNPLKRTNIDYLKHILESGHGSVLEHANYSILAEGVSRSLTHEWVRHRAGWAYSQLSQRFVDESDAAFVVPPAMLDDSTALGELEDQCEAALKSYGRLVARMMLKYADMEDKTLRRKKARESARAVLPNCTETKIVLTGNVRAWRTVLGIRGDPAADAEINRLSIAIAQVLKVKAPAFFQDLTIAEDGVSFDFRKV